VGDAGVDGNTFENQQSEVKMNKGISMLLLAAAIGFGLAGCGNRDRFGTDNGTGSTTNNPEIVATGTVATDSWGYTGAAPDQVAAPDRTALTLAGHTLLADAGNRIVSGVIPTSLGFSLVAPNAAAHAPAPTPTGQFLCYVNLALGTAATATPIPSVSVTVGVPGETLSVFNFDPVTDRWTSGQTAIVDSSGKITFPVSRLSLWGVFR
jgi:hypothetical protein